jgi:hypothetical protein
MGFWDCQLCLKYDELNTVWPKSRKGEQYIRWRGRMVFGKIEGSELRVGSADAQIFTCLET